MRCHRKRFGCVIDGNSQVNEGPQSDASSVPNMPVKLENVGIAVRDIVATIAFFTDLGLTVVGRDTVSGELAEELKKS